jgi:hypothetical protein
MRRGAVAVVMLVLLTLVVTVAAVWLRQTALLAEQCKLAEQAAQAECLAESALRRAAVQLVAKRDYAGEKWSVAAESIGRAWPAEAVIKVTTPADQAHRRRVEVEATFPAGTPAGSRVSRTVEMDF